MFLPSLSLSLSLSLFLAISLRVKDFYMRCLWNVLDVNKHISNMSHKAKGLDRNRNKKRSLSLGSYASGEKQRLQCPARSQKQQLLVRASIQIL